MTDEFDNDNAEENNNTEILYDDDFEDEEEIMRYYEMDDDDIIDINALNEAVDISEIDKAYDYYNEKRLELGEYLISELYLPVIPLYPFDYGDSKAGKVPLIKGWNDRTETTIEELMDWLNKDVYTNLGLPLGKHSGVVAIDVDGYDNGGKDILDELSDGDLPDTIQYTTPNGGMRYLYAIPAEHRDKKFKKYTKNGNSEHTGVELLGDGQQTVLPYSIHPKQGKIYDFVENHSFDDTYIVTMPKWMENLMLSGSESSKKATTAEKDNRQGDVVEASEELRLFFSECPRLMEILEQQETYGDIDYQTWFHVLVILLKANKRHLAYEFSELYKVEDTEATERQIESIEKSIEEEKIQGYIRCTTLGCSKHFVKKCHRKVYKNDNDEVINSPYNMLKLNDLEDAGFNYNDKTGYLEFVNGNVFSRYVHSHIKVKRRTRDVFYRYCEDKNYWVNETIDDFKDYLIGFFNGIDKDTWLARFENQYMRNVIADTEKIQPKKSNLMIINLKNGLYSIKKKKFFRHDETDTSRVFTTSQLPVDYDPDADCPKFKQFLANIFRNSKQLVDLIQEIMGYCLTTETKAHKIFLFQGDGSNGKTVLCNIITKLIGEENTSSISLSAMNKDFSVAEIVDKLVNISTESEVSSLNTEKIKAISSGDAIQINAKFAGVYSYKPFAKLIFCVNNLPYMSDKTEAMRRRLVIIPFEMSFVEGEPQGDGQMKMDKDIEAKLTQELAGIFNFALEGLARLESNKYTFTESKEALRKLNEFLEDNNPILNYVRNEIELGQKEKIDQKVLFNNFKDWCNDNNHKRTALMTFNTFLNEFRATLKRENIVFDKTHSGDTIFITGIKLKKVQNQRRTNFSAHP